jgi:hypothetical protein
MESITFLANDNPSLKVFGLQGPLRRLGNDGKFRLRKVVRITRRKGIRYVLINPSDPAPIIVAFRRYRASHWSEPPALSTHPLPDGAMTLATETTGASGRRDVTGISGAFYAISRD